MSARSALSGVALLGVLALGGCATSPGSQAPASSDAPAGQSLGSLMPGPPEGEVIGTGTVMDVAGVVELCLGPVAESYPPQCTGIPLENWSWEGVDDAEQVDEVRWGSYALTGTYDGDSFAITQSPIPLALYDPAPVEDPTGGEPGSAEDAELQRVQDEIGTRFGPRSEVFLSSYPENGYVWVEVVWDDGTLQQAADDDFGAGVVVIRSALREAG